MSCEFICDGCGKREKANTDAIGHWIKPKNWFQRGDDDGTQDACSRECIEKVSKESGKTGVVLPL